MNGGSVQHGPRPRERKIVGELQGALPGSSAARE